MTRCAHMEARQREIPLGAAMSRFRSAIGAAALASVGAAVVLWFFLPQFLVPAPLGALVLFGTAFAGAAATSAAFALAGRVPSPGVLAVLVGVQAAIVAAAISALIPPALAAGNRYGVLAIGLTLAVVTALLAAVAGRRTARAPLAAGLAAIAVVTFGSFVVGRLSERPVASVRTLLVGLDGTTWTIMKPMRRAGELPTIARIMREGAAGVLESEDPTLSPRVWTTIATGKTPDQHHIVDFETPQSALRAARVWEILEGEGMKVGVFGYLVTWPPVARNGFLVPGWEARGPEALPAELSFVRYKPHSKVEALALAVAFVRHGVRLGSLVDGARAVVRYRGWTDQGYSAATAFVQLALETDVFLHLLRQHQPAFATFVVTGSDTVSHLYWRYMDAEHFPDVPPADRARYGDVIPRYYREADRALARLLASLSPDAHAVVVSDHGNGPLISSRQTLSIKVAELLDRLGMPREEVTVTTISGTAHFETKSSAAQGELRRKLEGVRWAGSGTPVFETELLSGSVVKARALKAGAGETAVVIDGQTLESGTFLREGKFSGDHTRHGIILAIGPRVDAQVRLKNARIRDVTPTLLALFDLPTADDMEGRVIDGLLTPPASADRRIASWNHHLPRFDQAQDTVGDEVRDRLKALGYL